MTISIATALQATETKNRILTQDNGPNGVFPDLIDQSGFIDTARFGVWGAFRTGIDLDRFQFTERKPIGGKRRRYAQQLRFVHKPTGNRIWVSYGPFVEFPNLPPYMVKLFSEGEPLTLSEVEAIRQGLFRVGAEFQPSEVELTFDVTRYSISEVRATALNKAERYRLLGNRKGRTIYLGSPKSPWQLRTYEKPDFAGVLRIEFILRRSFLADRDINSPERLIQAKNINLSELVGFWRIDPSMLVSELPEISGWRKEFLLGDQLWMVEKAGVLRQGWGIKPRLVSRRLTEIDELLQAMQAKLVW